MDKFIRYEILIELLRGAKKRLSKRRGIHICTTLMAVEISLCKTSKYDAQMLSDVCTRAIEIIDYGIDGFPTLEIWMEAFHRNEARHMTYRDYNNRRLAWLDQLIFQAEQELAKL